MTDDEGALWRGDLEMVARAPTSLPVRLSPEISTVESAVGQQSDRTFALAHAELEPHD